jgi:hypothetical protein
MTYWGNGRNRFQIEIPISAISNLNLEDYELTSQRKGFRRYIFVCWDYLSVCYDARWRSLQISTVEAKTTN